MSFKIWRIVGGEAVACVDRILMVIIWPARISRRSNGWRLQDRGCDLTDQRRDFVGFTACSRGGRTGTVPGRIFASAFLATALVCQSAVGQEVPASEHGSVSQTVSHTQITVVYNRPVARGRRLFGGIVAWGRVWCPGADQATTIEATHDIHVNGSVLPAGKYSLWAIPDTAQWTIIFSRAANVFHIPYPEGQDALRIQATPRAGPHMETLAFYFPLADSSRAELDLHWGETIVPLAIEAP